MNLRTLILLATISTGLLRADVLTYTVTPNAGQFSYQFTLTNTGARGGTLFDLFLSLQTDITKHRHDHDWHAGRLGGSDWRSGDLWAGHQPFHILHRLVCGFQYALRFGDWQFAARLLI